MTDDNESPVIPIGTTNFEPGMHEGVAMATYLDDAAVSASRLWTLHEETPAHFYHQLVQEREEGRDDATRAKKLGEVTHTAVLEPDEFEDRYVVLGQCEGVKRDGDQCSYQGSIYRDGQSFCGTHDPAKGEPEAPGIYTVAADLKQRASGMKERLHGHPVIRQLLAAPGPREVTGVWQDPATGLWCRIRPDWLIHDPPVVPEIFHFSACNLKTTGLSASPFAMPRTVEKQGWYFKAAFYRMGLWALGFDVRHLLYPVVESTPPHEPILYRMDEDALDIGETEVREAMNQLAECRETGKWPGYRTTVQKLTLTDWRLRQVHSVDFLDVDEADDATEAAA